MKPTLAAFLLLACSAPLAAQCQNLVPNGGFDAPTPAWTVASGSATVGLEMLSVGGTGVPSDALVVSASQAGAAGTTVIEQPSPMTLIGGAVYFVRANLMLDVPGSGGTATVEILVEDAGGVTTSVGVNSYSPAAQTTTLLHRFVAPSSGDYTVAVRFVPNGALSVCAIDDLVVAPMHGPVFAFVGENRLTGASSDWRMVGNGDENAFVFLSLEGFTFEFSFPPCGVVPIDFPVAGVPEFIVPLGGSGLVSLSGGVATGSFTIPIGFDGFPLQWQAIALPPACAVGCTQSFGFADAATPPPPGPGASGTLTITGPDTGATGSSLPVRDVGFFEFPPPNNSVVQNFLFVDGTTDLLNQFYPFGSFPVPGVDFVDSDPINGFAINVFETSPGQMASISMTIRVSNVDYDYTCINCPGLSIDRANRFVDFSNVVVNAAGGAETGGITLNGRYEWP